MRSCRGAMQLARTEAMGKGPCASGFTGSQNGLMVSGVEAGDLVDGCFCFFMGNHDGMMRQFVGQRAPFLSWSQPDTLLNVFLAIAVDNLANAQELTKVCKTPPAA